MSLNVHVLQHAAFEGLGAIAPWLNARGDTIGYTRFFANEPLPPVDAVDMLIAMGGPMSVNDEAEFPWLKAEKAFVRDVVARDIPVLGVCLGAQLVASALGARVYPNPVKEIGWFPIQAPPAPNTAFRFPAELLVFHWHGETFDLPAGAVLLARSAACEHQAFQFKDNVIGLQFHLETTAESVAGMVANCGGELMPAPYIQSAQVLAATSASAYATANETMVEVLTYLAARTERAR